MARSSVSAGNTITIGIKFYNNGVLFEPSSIISLKIYDAASGGNIVTTLTPTVVSIGFYQATWEVPTGQTPQTYYDSWVWLAVPDMPTKTQRYSFVVTEAIEAVEEEETVVREVSCRTRPTWVHFIGIRRVEDMGNGMGLRLTYEDALPADIDNQVHYNIYYSNTRYGVFGDGPKAITTGRPAVINGFTPGDNYYLSVKATDFNPAEFDISELNQIGNDIFSYPDAQTLQEDMDAYGSTVIVEDSTGFPDKGFLLIGTEIVKYTGFSENSFPITLANRGVIGTVIEAHFEGESVTLWHGIEDQNSNVLTGTATWHNVTPRNVSAIGEYNVADDGYKETAIDILTTDLSASDDSGFAGYDYCGYHKTSLQDTFSGKCVGSYVGGDFNGSRGLDFQDRNLGRLEAMLNVTGEKCVLLRRKWTGRRCSCIDLRREHQRSRCSKCYQVGFAGGYDRYINPRAVSEYERNTQGFIMIRVDPFVDDLEIVQDQGLRQKTEINAWTLSVPAIKDRDMVVRFIEDGSVEFIYECLSATRNKLFFGQTGKQKILMKRMDKSDEIYQFTDIFI